MKEKLLEAAKKAQKNAYAPYSKFHVGAALLSESGKIYTGCNVENASFGLTNCAERTAIFKMVSEGDKEIKEMLILGPKDDILPPCGACRQVISEFAKPDVKVYMCSANGNVQEITAGELLPYGFIFEK